MKMCDKISKQKLYLLLEAYISGNKDEMSFCNEFHALYNLNSDELKLSEKEQFAFDTLEEATDWFSDSEQDFALYPGLYVDKTHLSKKIYETFNTLKGHDLKYPDDSVDKIAEIGDDRWLICPICIDAWISPDVHNAMVKCPKCKQYLQNPRYTREN